eukprot:jgi/Phyca11/120141/e_gw1.40.164.1
MPRTCKLHTFDQRQRVLDAARDGGDWPLVAEHNGVKYKKAWGWVKHARESGNWTVVLVQRGGACHKKTQEEHVKRMASLL